MLTKACCRCNVTKSTTDFPKASVGKFGVHSICRTCKAIYMVEYRLSGKLKLSKDKYRKSEHGKAKIKAYTESSKNKEIQKAYRETEYGKAACVFKLSKYRAMQKQALPSWASLKVLKAIYRQCPSGFEVDHIVPLQGETVSGLHVPWNLQYLSRHDNASKANQFDGTPQNNEWRTRAA